MGERGQKSMIYHSKKLLIHIAQKKFTLKLHLFLTKNHDLKSLHNRLIVNSIKNIIFNIQNQTKIQPIIFDSVAQSVFYDLHAENVLYTRDNS